MKNENETDKLLSVGQSGDLIILKKERLKEGHKSTIKPGNIRELVIKKPLAVGHPVVEKKISDRQRTSGVVLGFQKTSTIIGIIQTEDGFKIETETSFYSVEFKKN